MRTISFAVAALLAAGCGASSTAPTASFNPVQAQSQPTSAQRVVPVGGQFSGGHGTFDTILTVNWDSVTGPGVVAHGTSDLTPVQAVGTLVAGSLDLRLYPDDVAKDTDVITLVGPLGGEAVWTDAGDGASGTCVPQDRSVIAPRLIDGAPSESASSPEHFSIQCDAADGRHFNLEVFLTTWNGVHQGYDGGAVLTGFSKPSGAASAFRFNGPGPAALLQVNTAENITPQPQPFQAAWLVFNLPDVNNRVTSLDSDSIIQPSPKDQRLRVTGTVRLLNP